MFMSRPSSWIFSTKSEVVRNVLVVTGPRNLTQGRNIRHPWALGTPHSLPKSPHTQALFPQEVSSARFPLYVDLIGSFPNHTNVSLALDILDLAPCHLGSLELATPDSSTAALAPNLQRGFCRGTHPQPSTTCFTRHPNSENLKTTLKVPRDQILASSWPNLSKSSYSFH